MKTNIISFKGWCCFLAVLLATVITYPVMAQQANTSISGVVTSSTDGRQLAAVSISTNSSLRETSTHNNGTFAIDATAQDRFITVNHVGYEAQQVNLGGKRTFQIILQSVNQDIETVVVTALGIKRSERSLGYSVGKVDGESLNTVVQENLLGGIAGKVPGVTLNQTGGVG